MKKFLSGRIKAVYYSLKGAFCLIKTEHSIQAQLFFSFLFIVAGFYLDISKVEWMFQILAISLVLTTESLNTAIEKILDFVHPDYNEKVGYIKDISAGAVFFAFIFALFTALMIYLPKLL